MFIVVGPLAGFVFRWNPLALLVAFLIGAAADIGFLGPLSIRTVPIYDGPIGLAGFALASSLASLAAILLRALRRIG